MECFCKEESYDLVLESDFGADPIWCEKCGCNLDLDNIPLTQELKNELINWVQMYSKSVINESEYVYEVFNYHNKKGIELLENVQKELGDRYTVFYKPS